MKSSQSKILLTVFSALALLVGGIAIGHYIPFSLHSETSTGCTLEAKLCPDGSAVGRTGPNCEFAECPSSQNRSECTSDADCPSPDYACEGTQGVGTISPGDNSESTYQITNGVCKKKEGKKCAADNDCASGLSCHQNKCTNPIGQKCNGASDKSCPSGYTCIQSCGPPLVRGDEPPPPYYCELNEYAKYPRPCPICLASTTKIATPFGEVSVRDIKTGMSVWSLDKYGRKIMSTVLAVSHTPVPTSHKVIHLTLSDRREVWASPGHPVLGGLVLSTLKPGDSYDGARVEGAETVLYWDTATYDLLPDSDTGYYWANGILLGSTLKE